MQVHKYPKYKYHAEFEPMLVRDEAQEKKLGPDWKESPADFGIVSAPSESSTPKPKAKAKK